MADQAKCDRCRIRYVWNPKLLPKDVDAYTRRLVSGRPALMWKRWRVELSACPECFHPLKRSHKGCRYPVKGTVPESVFNARALAVRGAPAADREEDPTK